LAIQQGVNTEMGDVAASVAVFGDDPAAAADSDGNIMAVLGDDESNT